VGDRRAAAEVEWRDGAVLVADGLGSALALLDPAGAVQAQYTYDAFGETTATGEASANAVQYTGRENDGTGLYYYRARYYSPRLQRFVSEDPLGFAAGDANLYGYVGNAPTMWVDPLGLDRMDRFLDGLQTALDGVGLVPGLEVADLGNAMISYGRGDNVGAGLSVAAMNPFGGQAATAVKVARRLNVTVRGTKQYAKDLFCEQVGNQKTRLMRDRKTGRLKGVISEDERLIYRPKGKKRGVTANVEVSKSNGTRVNVHVRP
jgi:RHS repeat-associated protein